LVTSAKILSHSWSTGLLTILWNDFTRVNIVRTCTALCIITHYVVNVVQKISQQNTNCEHILSLVRFPSRRQKFSRFSSCYENCQIKHCNRYTFELCKPTSSRYDIRYLLLRFFRSGVRRLKSATQAMILFQSKSYVVNNRLNFTS